MGQMLQNLAFLPSIATRGQRVKYSKDFLKLRTYEQALQADAEGNSALHKVNENVYYVTARKTMRLFGPLSSFVGYTGSVMAILKHGDELTLVNTQRIKDSQLEELDELGTVKNIVRLGAHASGEPFYIERYPDAEYWLLEGAERHEGLQKEVRTLSDEASELPIPGMKVFQMAQAKIPEAQIIVPNDHGGVLVACDALQHHESCIMPQASIPVSLFYYARGISGVARVSPVVLDFAFEAHGIDPRQIVTEHFDSVLQNEFESFIPGHGKPIFTDAYAIVRESLQRQKFLSSK